MAGEDWADGYVVDVDYTSGYFRELSPAQLRFVLLLGGLEPPAPAQPCVYYELGCGNGHSLALHAAADPAGRYTGVDFNPAHILHARKLAQDAGIGNATFLEKSFAELLDLPLEDADIVALHGVWSWVGAEPRAQLLEFLRRRLKPGGILYLSYNCLPGLAQVAPLQRLLNAHAETSGGERMERVRRSIDFATRLQKAGALYFGASPLAARRLASLEGHDPRYLAHEYYNEHWAPSYHADVARELAGAKLTYAGSCALIDNFAQFVLKPEQAKLVAEIGDRALAETVKDYARNQVFRRDVFTRGAQKAAPPALEAALASTRFALLRPRGACLLKTRTPAGEVTLQPEAYAPVLDALARGPMTFEELARAPQCAQFDRARLRQAVFGVVAFGNVFPALPAEGEEARKAATDRYNAAVLRMPINDAGVVSLASPVLGAGIGVNLLDRLFLEHRYDRAKILEIVRAEAAAGKLKLKKDDRPMETAAERNALIEERAARFDSDVLPFLQQLRVAG